MEPNWSYHQIQQKQKIGTPTSKSCEPLIAEDDYELTADCCFQLPYMSYNWYRPIFGFSVYLTTEVVNPFKLSNWLSYEGIFVEKMDDIYFDQLIKSYRLPSKKKSICLSSKVDFFAVGQLSNVIT